ncbi:hypothetical protein ACFYQA_20405 [Streptomyces sp. NPDC005774]|uniref:hypothetical protein n=1 Tax=Streptomyces sp. NPDC005774 TaxID=3364728 RepID=UPI0036A47841
MRLPYKSRTLVGLRRHPAAHRPVARNAGAHDDADPRTTVDAVLVGDAVDAVLVRLVGDASGEARLSEDQRRALPVPVAGHYQVLVVRRTGWDESAVPFRIASLLRAGDSGPTVIAPVHHPTWR